MKYIVLWKKQDNKTYMIANSNITITIGQEIPKEYLLPKPLTSLPSVNIHVKHDTFDKALYILSYFRNKEIIYYGLLENNIFTGLISKNLK